MRDRINRSEAQLMGDRCHRLVVGGDGEGRIQSREA